MDSTARSACAVCVFLMRQRFRLWSAPVDTSTVDGAAYTKAVGGFPMELATLLERVNGRHVIEPSCFRAHLQRIVACTERYFTGRDEESLRTVRRVATRLQCRRKLTRPYSAARWRA